MAEEVNMFLDLKKPHDFTKYTLFRGTTDWSQLSQFDNYESGFNFLVCVSIPEFMTKLAAKNTDGLGELIRSYRHIIEREFKGMDSGLENISAETQEISNGARGINFITKTTVQGGSTMSMRYTEKSGSVLTRVHEMYLRSIRDGDSTFKHYGGLINYDGGDGGIAAAEAGFEKECFSFLYMATDNTGLLLEKSVYWVGCQPSSAELSIFNGEKGNVQFHEVGVEFNGFPITGAKIDKRASEILRWMHSSANTAAIQRNSWTFDYKGIANDVNGLSQPSLTTNSK